MRAMSRRVVAVVVFAALCSLSTGLAAVAHGDEAAEAGTSPLPTVAYGSTLTVLPGVVSGRILCTDGTTPAVEVPVRVWSFAAEAFVHEVTTDEQGAYSLPELEVGRYYVVFGDRVCVDLRVEDDAELAEVPLNVIVPRGHAMFAQMTPERRSAVLTLLGQYEPGGRTVAGAPLRTVLIVGGGTATAIGIAIVVENILDDDHKSP